MSRSREFDIDKALEASLEVFWEKGYHNSSLTDLTVATGLHKGSLYAAFKSKEQLFLDALELYATRSRARFLEIGCPVDYIQNFFVRLTNEGANKEYSKGCFILNSSVEFGVENSKPAKLSRSLFKEVQKNFRYVIESADKLEMLPKDFDKKAFGSRLIGAIFSIREISRFSDDKKLFKDIANGVLKDLGRKI